MSEVVWHHLPVVVVVAVVLVVVLLLMLVISDGCMIVVAMLLLSLFAVVVMAVNHGQRNRRGSANMPNPLDKHNFPSDAMQCGPQQAPRRRGG